MSFVRSNPIELLTDAAFIAAVVTLVVINLRTMILPNKITYPGFALAILVRAFIPNFASFGLLNQPPFSKLPTFLVSIDGAFIGAIIGGGSLLLVRWAWERLRGIEALGLGDVKMMCMIGAYLGIAKTILVLSLVVVLMFPAMVIIALVFAKRSNMLWPSGFIWGIPAIVATLLGENILKLLS
jgi:leader peptidase (prepilin peptidase)/N-methyltransferase